MKAIIQVIVFLCSIWGAFFTSSAFAVRWVCTAAVIIEPDGAEVKGNYCVDLDGGDAEFRIPGSTGSTTASPLPPGQVPLGPAERLQGQQIAARKIGEAVARGETPANWRNHNDLEKACRCQIAPVVKAVFEKGFYSGLGVMIDGDNFTIPLQLLTPDRNNELDENLRLAASIVNTWLETNHIQVRFASPASKTNSFLAAHDTPSGITVSAAPITQTFKRTASGQMTLDGKVVGINKSRDAQGKAPHTEIVLDKEAIRFAMGLAATVTGVTPEGSTKTITIPGLPDDALPAAKLVYLHLLIETMVHELAHALGLDELPKVAAGSLFTAPDLMRSGGKSIALTPEGQKKLAEIDRLPEPGRTQQFIEYTKQSISAALTAGHAASLRWVWGTQTK